MGISEWGCVDIGKRYCSACVNGNIMGDNLWEKIRPFILNDSKRWYMNWEKIILKTSWSHHLGTKVSSNYGRDPWKTSGLSSNSRCRIIFQGCLTDGPPTSIWPLWAGSAHCWTWVRELSLGWTVLLVRKFFMSRWNCLPLIFSQSSSFNIQQVFSPFLMIHSKYLKTTIL